MADTWESYLTAVLIAQVNLKDPADCSLSAILLGTVTRGLESSDRFIVIRCMETLGRLAQRGENECRGLVVWNCPDPSFELSLSPFNPHVFSSSPISSVFCFQSLQLSSSFSLPRPRSYHTDLHKDTLALSHPNTRPSWQFFNLHRVSLYSLLVSSCNSRHFGAVTRILFI